MLACSHSPKFVHKHSGVELAKGLEGIGGTRRGSAAWTHPELSSMVQFT